MTDEPLSREQATELVVAIHAERDAIDSGREKRFAVLKGLFVTVTILAVMQVAVALTLVGLPFGLGGGLLGESDQRVAAIQAERVTNAFNQCRATNARHDETIRAARAATPPLPKPTIDLIITLTNNLAPKAPSCQVLVDRSFPSVTP